MEEKLNKLNSKVNFLVFLVIVSLFLNIMILGGGSSQGVVDDDPTQDLVYDVSDFKEITAADIASFDKDEINVIYIGRETCVWCLNMLDALKQAQKDYGYTTKYIDISKIIDFSKNVIIDAEAYETLTNLKTAKDQEGVMAKFGSTPMMLIMKNNKIIASQVGYSDYDTFAKVLEKGGLKK